MKLSANNEEAINILTVDDEEYNLLIIEEFLEPTGYTITAARNGEEAWAILERDPEKFDAILLDWIMPKMDGIEVLKKIRAHKILQYVPTIMQTACARTEHIIQGIEAGAYYYITKPYEEELFLAVIKAAVADRERFKKLALNIAEYPDTLKLLDRGQFRISALEEGHALAAFLSCAYPSPIDAMIGLTELMSNALEFGLAGLTYDEKSTLIHEQRLQSFVSNKLASPALKDKSVKVVFNKTDDEIIVSVEDQGIGFNWEQYIYFSPDRATDSHGRGIATANLVSFDKLTYTNNGTKAIALVKLAPDSDK